MFEPRVTVLMPIYNSEKYLALSIDSILNQTFTNFELLAIYEPSQDHTLDILYRYGDSRLRIIENPVRLGVARTLSKGLDLAKGDLIARMDADDISFPDRLQIQADYLDHHPEIGLFGTTFQVIDEQGKLIRTQLVPSDPVSVHWRLLFGNCIAHPLVMFRKRIALDLGGYDIQASAGEDFDLWVRFAARSRIAQNSRALGQWRDHAANLSTTEPVKSKDHYVWTVAKSVKLQTGQQIDFDTAQVLFRDIPCSAANSVVLKQAYATILSCLVHMQSDSSLSSNERNQLVDLALRDILWMMQKNAGSRMLAVQTAFRCLSRVHGSIFMTPILIVSLTLILLPSSVLSLVLRLKDMYSPKF